MNPKENDNEIIELTDDELDEIFADDDFDNGEQVGAPMLIDEDGCTIELDFTNTYTATVPHTGSASIMIASAVLVTLGSTIATVRTRKESLKQ